MVRFRDPQMPIICLQQNGEKRKGEGALFRSQSCVLPRLPSFPAGEPPWAGAVGSQVREGDPQAPVHLFILPEAFQRILQGQAGGHYQLCSLFSRTLLFPFVAGRLINCPPSLFPLCTTPSRSVPPAEADLSHRLCCDAPPEEGL